MFKQRNIKTYMASHTQINHRFIGLKYNINYNIMNPTQIDIINKS